MRSKTDREKFIEILALYRAAVAAVARGEKTRDQVYLDARRDALIASYDLAVLAAKCNK
jgi:hypothetical protein